jgi:hypothetical protein
MQLAKFRYGRVVMVTYWVSHSLSQGVFPRWTFCKPCKEDEVDGGKTFGHGVHDIQGFVLSLLSPISRDN